MPQPPPGRARPCAQRQLVHEAATGNPDAREQLVHIFWPHMAGVARIYQGLPTVDHAELMQEGVAGLLTALKHYDPERGIPFWGYASWWVRQAMQQLVAQLTGPIVLSDRAARCLARLRHARRQHLQKCGHEPSTAELSHLTGLPRDHIERLLGVERAARSLDEPITDGQPDSATLSDRVADPSAQDPYDRLLERLQIDDVGELPNRLAPRERRVVRARYGLGEPTQTLKQLGDALGVSAERVRQIEEHALDHLRDELRARGREECHPRATTAPGPHVRAGAQARRSARRSGIH